MPYTKWAFLIAKNEKMYEKKNIIYLYLKNKERETIWISQK